MTPKHISFSAFFVFSKKRFLFHRRPITYHQPNGQLDDEPHVADELDVEECFVRLTVRFLPVLHDARPLARVHAVGARDDASGALGGRFRPGR